MANKEHLWILKDERGISVWNKWRSEHREIIPDLRNADLRGAELRGVGLLGADLRGANLLGAGLLGADLFGANLRGTNLRGANLNGANLREADLTKADVREADVREANLRGANLLGADLREANLSGADLREANLSGADLSGADLRGADFGGANLSWASLNGANLNDSRMGYTSVLKIDLSGVKGLETVEHTGPSSVGIDTIYLSEGEIPDIFLRGAGVPDNFITYMKSLVGTPAAFEYYSCFISYSSKDEAFAKCLYVDLQSIGVRCWFAPEEVKIGDRFRERIDEAVRVYDKLLLILSTDSIESPWVEDEVEAAFEKERQQNKLVLFPIRLDDAVMTTPKAWAARVRRIVHMGDFTNWKNKDSYQEVFNRLLRDLKSVGS